MNSPVNAKAAVMAGKGVVIWLGILLLAIVNGLFREAILAPELGKVPGFLASGVLLSALILFVSWLTLPWFGHPNGRQCLAIGAGWLLLTLVFEFSFGLVRGLSWSRLLDAYTFRDGNIWPLVLLVTAMAPYISARVRGW